MYILYGHWMGNFSVMLKDRPDIGFVLPDFRLLTFIYLHHISDSSTDGRSRLETYKIVARNYS